MHSSATLPVGSPLSSRLVRSSLALVLVSGLVLGALGCGGGPKESKDNISGKVTLNGQPVAGMIEFSAGGKSQSGPISPDGSYKINDPPIGEADVTIKGFGGAAAGGAPQPIKDGGKPGGAAMPGGTSMGVAPPAKYGTAGFLKHTVPAGKSTKDFELQP